MARLKDPDLVRTWQLRLQRHSSSGLSISAFCAREGFSPASFYAWKRRLSVRSLRGRPEPALFVPLHLTPRAPEGGSVSSQRVEVELPHQVRLRFDSAPEPEWLGQLVAAIGGLSGQEVAS